MRTIRRTFLAIAFLTLLIAGWKGVSLWMLSNAIDAQAKNVALFYRDNFRTHTGTLSGATLTRGQKEIIDRLPHLPLEADLARKERIGAIIEAQRAYAGLIEVSQNTPLLQRPELQELQESMRRDGRVQPVLDTYNKKAQQWNNQQDDFVGGLFWSVLNLEPRLLLQPDGTMEYETTVTL